jgi:hypothetical protein
MVVPSRAPVPVRDPHGAACSHPFTICAGGLASIPVLGAVWTCEEGQPHFCSQPPPAGERWGRGQLVA